jgi:hypothetical protein
MSILESILGPTETETRLRRGSSQKLNTRSSSEKQTFADGKR